MTTTRVLAAWACAIALASCRGGDASHPPLASGPSDGHPTHIVIDADALRSVEAELDLRVGSVDDPDYSLTDFLIMEVDDDGQIFTLHRQERFVRRFLPDGTLDGVIGGPGGGPGEFGNPLWMGWVGDSLWVLDTSGYRFSYFDTDGEFLRSASIPFSMEPNAEGLPDPRARGLLWDGRIHGEMPAFSDLIDSGAITHDLSVLLAGNGTVADTIRPRLPLGRRGLTIRRPTGSEAYLSGSQPVNDYPFVRFVNGEDARVIVERSVYEESPGASYTVSKVSFSGDTIFSAHGDPVPVPLPEAEIDSAVERWVQSLGNVWGLAPAAARDLVREAMFLPPNRPGVAMALVSKTGEIWLKETTDGPVAPWIVLTADGGPSFRVEVPDEVQVMVAGETELWGRLDDDLGVPYLVRYRFERP